jgi:hypothetical protein
VPAAGVGVAHFDFGPRGPRKESNLDVAFHRAPRVTLTGVRPLGIWHDHPAAEGLIVDLQAIRVRIRAKLRDGSLPPNSVPRAFGHPGNGENCVACEEILTAARLMMELTNNAKTFLLHGDCYLLWREERPAPTS